MLRNTLTDGNQIRVVALHLAQGSFLQKRLQNVFLEICNAEIAVLTKIERQFSNKVIVKWKFTINVF